MAPPTRDVVVLLPGITGSVLEKDGKPVWAPTRGAVLRGLLSLGRSLRTLEVVDDDPTADDLGDGVRATGLVGAAHLVPGLWKIDVYSELEDFLVSGLGLTKGRNYFPFPYDWRRDNRASARQLQRQSRRWLREWRESSGAHDARLVLIGHSMGGLVARYFVEALEGWRDTRAVITYGTPFYGSLNAVDFLVNGFSKGIGPFQADLTPLVQSMTSVHQLVPSYRCVQLGGEAVRPAVADLPGWSPAWDDHLEALTSEIEAGAAQDRGDVAPVAYHPIVGRDQPTLQSALLDGGRLRLLRKRGDKDESGDGTVPLLSAAVSGTQSMRTFVPDQHSRLQSSVPMQTHLKGLLAGTSEARIDDLRDAVTAWFGLDVDDVHLPGEPVRLEVTPYSSLDEGSLPTVDVSVRVHDEATGEPVVHLRLEVPRAPTGVDLGVLPPSTYRVQVTGSGSSAPVSDVFTVASPAEVLGDTASG